VGEVLRNHGHSGDAAETRFPISLEGAIGQRKARGPWPHDSLRLPGLDQQSELEVARGEKLRPWSNTPESVRRVASRPPTPRPLSNTNTPVPFSCTVQAAISPLTPAPITMTSACEPGVIIPVEQERCACAQV